MVEPGLRPLGVLLHLRGVRHPHLIAAGALLPPGAAVAGFLLGYLAITVVVVTLLQLVL